MTVGGVGCPIEWEGARSNLFGSHDSTISAALARLVPNMRVLVTGGAGFLGSHLCDRLIGQGDDVICMDNLFTGRKSNITHLLSNPNFELVRHDVIDPTGGT